MNPESVRTEGTIRWLASVSSANSPSTTLSANAGNRQNCRSVQHLAHRLRDLRVGHRFRPDQVDDPADVVVDQPAQRPDLVGQ